ncbi:2-dehydropantoate 2-reductase N-terminal domain-containing protein [Intrasporangium sp.]|uniref:mannitol dehydrogenase family protein n=1 Tax=Intrasporangium sp. TaxID=1925024 RepID=UPI0032216DB8
MNPVRQNPAHPGPVHPVPVHPGPVRPGPAHPTVRLDRTVVVVGAGRVGLGCAAHLAHRGGCRVQVLGRGSTIAALAGHGLVRVRVTDGALATEEDVPVSAIDLHRDPEGARAAIAGADLVCTAVGAGSLPALVPLLADGLARADHAVDVVAFENLADAGRLLRQQVGAGLSVPHGFSGAVVDRVVAHRLPATAATPVTVVAEPACQVAVDRNALNHDWSVLPGVVGVDDFRAWFRRKLYRYSAGHATAAYLGRLKGYRFLHAAAADPEIAEEVLAAMEEGRRGLLHRYGSRVAGTPADLHEILARFGNAALGDTTARVGRDVPRKVARDERLVGAARAAARAGVTPRHLAQATAAAISAELAATGQRAESAAERAETVARFTGLAPHGRLGRLVAACLDQLDATTVLLSLAERTPAWETGVVGRAS